MVRQELFALLLHLALVNMSFVAAEPSCRADASSEACAKKQKMQQELSEHVTTRADVRMPRIIYGTAWKKERTEDLVIHAVKSGFRGIDTACQPKHYNEPGVGSALQSLIGKEIHRKDLFIQTKVNKNYALELLPDATIEEQVGNAISKSLSNLRLSYVDSLVLHSPYKLHNDTIEAWRTMEDAVRAGKVRQLGISNVRSMRELKRVYEDAEIKPAVVQQRFYAKTGFEREMRSWCLENNVGFQSFWTLTANSKSGKPGRNLLTLSSMRDLAAKYNVSVEVLFFRYIMGAGIVPLTGTCNLQHMAQDLAARSVPLTAEDDEHIQKLMHEQLSALESSETS